MILWIFLAFMPIVLGAKKECPGGSMKCADSETCCELLDKSYGCCPLQNATCCDDHIHCCPSNTKCSAGMCIQGDYQNKSIEIEFIRNNDIICPGGIYACPDSTTCCKGIHAPEYDCCPMKNAVCCADHIHCCPQGTICDPISRKCKGKGFISQMYDSKKNNSLIPNLMNYIPINLKPNSLNSIICPGSSFQCPNEYTCCKFPTSDWGCCPYTNGVCCNDHLHCCPAHMKCDATSTSCIQGFRNITAIPNKPAEPVLDNILCPDKTYCSDDMTCCSLKNKHFGCCPYQNAVCCPDQQHCCPNGYECNEVLRKCLPKQKWLYLFLKSFYGVQV